MRPRGLIAALVGAATVAGSLWWILHAVLSLEAAERQARRHAAHEERARLALWRMDSALSTFLAFENATPVEAPPGYNAETPMIARRFEVTADQEIVADRETKASQPPPSAQQLLALLDQPPLDPGPPPPPPPAKPRPRPQQPIGTPGAGTRPEVKAKKAPVKEAPSRKAEPESDEDALARRNAFNAVSQAQLNRAEFEQRSRVAGQQAQLAPLEPPPGQQQSAGDDEGAADDAAHPAAIELRADEIDEVADDDQNKESQTPSAIAPPPPVPPLPAPPAGPTGIVRPLAPLWLDGDLVLVRRIVRAGSEALQGLELDDEATRAWLLDQVQDLLPNSRLEPVRADVPSDPGRQLALLPLRLVPGPPPPLGDDGVSSVRLGVLLALASMALVALAAGTLVLAGLRLARRRSDFASAVIHELRTPLTTFRLYTDMLAEGAVPASDQPRYLRTLRRESDRLGHLVENVLAYARLETRRRPQVAPLHLATWLRESAPRLEEQAAHEDLTLELTIAPEAEDVYVAAEPLALERILHNLCDNSCKYAAAGKRLELTATAEKRKLLLAWRDHGPGIPHRTQRRLLRPFQRGTHTPGQPKEIHGIGLGLALCQQLTKRLGGKLRLIDHPGDGVEVEITLARVAGPAAEPEPSA